jgi:pimeloyl-ACP methyl ester carboxylesterase
VRSVFLPYKQSQIHYLVFGRGEIPAICFHGYGEQSDSFSFLEHEAGHQYTFYAIDLPFHGQTEWNEGLVFHPDDLLAIVQRIIPSTYSRPALIGYSLGGRMALSLYEQWGGLPARLLLLAPDGLKVNFWYRLATQNSLGRHLFHFTMQHPGWFFMLLKWLNQLKLVNTSIFKFVNHYIGDENVRQALYERWITLRKVQPNLPLIKRLLIQKNTRCFLLYGMHDRIILPVRGEKFRKGMEANCSISLIHSGHQVLNAKHIHEILPALLD